VDAHYRTLATPASRGIYGHSMGGTGALTLAMSHPDVFGAVYASSPALFDPQGLSDSQMFASPEVIDYVLQALDMVSQATPDQARSKFLGLSLQGGAGERMSFAYGAAFSPTPDQKPPYILYPYRKVGGQFVRDPNIWKQWESGFGGIADKLARYQNNLKQLKGIVVEYGEQDENPWLPRGCRYFSQQLTAAGIPNTLLTFSGGHFDQLGTRIEGYVLPFFSRMLVSEEN